VVSPLVDLKPETSRARAQALYLSTSSPQACTLAPRPCLPKSTFHLSCLSIQLFAHFLTSQLSVLLANLGGSRTTDASEFLHPYTLPSFLHFQSPPPSPPPPLPPSHTHCPINTPLRVKLQLAFSPPLSIHHSSKLKSAGLQWECIP
jgi:hypothetical protein